MSEKENKTMTEGENKENAFVGFCKKAWNGTVNFFKAAWSKIKAIPWNQPVRPVVAWSILGGVVGLAVILMLIFWL